MLNFYLISHSKSWCNVIKCFLNKLPEPDLITEEWILDFFTQYSNLSTKSFYRKMLSIVLGRLGKKHLLENIKISQPKTLLRPSDLLTDNDIHSLLIACYNFEQRAIIELLAESGCRASELLNLTINDISLEDSLVIFTFTGKGHTRSIPIHSSNLTNLLDHLRFITSGNIFSLNYKQLRRTIINIFQRANIQKRKRTIHIFRHTVATRLVEQGIPEPLLRQFMGWTPESKMVSIYVHLSNKTLKDYMLRLHSKEIKEVFQ